MFCLVTYILTQLISYELFCVALVMINYQYKKGAHLSHPLIHFQKLTKGSIKFEKELMVNVDGEIFTTDFLDFEVLPKALRFARVCGYRKI